MKAQPVPRDLPSETDLFVAFCAEKPARTPPLAAQQVMLVPGQAVPVMALDLPAALRGQAREQVARRQLQEMTGLAPDVLEMRPFVVPQKGGGQNGGWQAALVAERTEVARWRQHAGKARAVLPDYLALPAAADLWVLEWTDAAAAAETKKTPDAAGTETDSAASGQLRVRLGVSDGFTAEMDLAVLLLQQALAARSDAPRPAAVFSTTPLAQLPEPLRAPLQAADLALYDDLQALAAAGLAAPKRLAHGELALDLRRDPYQARTLLRRNLRAAFAPLLAGLLAAALWAADTQLERRALERDIAALEQEMLAQLRAGLLPEGPIFDVRRQVAQALARHAAATAAEVSASAPLVLLAGVAEVLTAHGARVEQLRYDDTGPGGAGQGRGEIRTQMRLPDFATAEALQADLRAAGFVLLNAESRSSETDTETDTGGVVLDLQITAGAQNGTQNGGLRDG